VLVCVSCALVRVCVMCVCCVYGSVLCVRACLCARERDRENTCAVCFCLS